MNNLNNILFSLIAPQLLSQNAKPCEVLDEKTLRAVYLLAKRHDLGHLLAAACIPGAKANMQDGCDDIQTPNAVFKDVSAEFVLELERARLTAAWRVRNTLNEQERVKKHLEKSEIPFIMLKGAVVRDYYPEAWMRTSSDIDVLVPRDMLSRAACLFSESDEYKVSEIAPDDAAFYAKSGVRVEIHTLFDGDGEDNAMLDSAWADAVCDGGCEHRMSAEHFYLYHLAHMAEHMRTGGCGIRPFIDLYLMGSRLDLDRDRLKSLLADLGLDRFDQAAVKLADAWMSGGDATDLESLEEYIITGGVYGSIEQGVAASRRDGQGKLGYVMHRIFMPYDDMRHRFKALDGRPWLTPIFWVCRWFGLLIPSKFKRSRAELKSTMRLDEARKASIEELFDSLGL